MVAAIVLTAEAAATAKAEAKTAVSRTAVARTVRITAAALVVRRSFQ